MKKASERVRYYQNINGPVIGTVQRKVIEKDGLYFKDLDGSGVYQIYDDWRLPAAQRAAAYVKKLSVKEKIGQLFIADWHMGIYQKDKTKVDATGLLDEGEVKAGESLFLEQDLPGTTTAIKEWFVRHMIFRANPQPNEQVDWLNQMHAVAEECEHFVPVPVWS